MKNKYKLVHHPFNVSAPQEARLFRNGDNFDYHFSPEIFSQTTTSEQKCRSKTYIELEIVDGECHIVSETDTIHEFETVADFYIPLNDESKLFYSDFHKNLVDENIEKITNYSQNIDRILQSGNLPYFPVPKLSTASQYENFSTNSSSFQDDKDSIYSTKIKFGDPIPSACSGRIKNIILKKYGSDTYNIQRDFLSKYFEENKISRYFQISKIYNQQLSEDAKSIFKESWLKSCLSEHAFFFISGPWRHCWVQLGYDPASDSDNYKYQVVSTKMHAKPIQLIELPKILEEVEKNKELYVLKTCDPLNGFISNSLKNLIEFYTEVKAD